MGPVDQSRVGLVPLVHLIAAQALVGSCDCHRQFKEVREIDHAASIQIDLLDRRVDFITVGSGESQEVREIGNPVPVEVGWCDSKDLTNCVVVVSSPAIVFTGAVVAGVLITIVSTRTAVVARVLITAVSTRSAVVAGTLITIVSAGTSSILVVSATTVRCVCEDAEQKTSEKVG